LIMYYPYIQHLLSLLRYHFLGHSLRVEVFLSILVLYMHQFLLKRKQLLSPSHEQRLYLIPFTRDRNSRFHTRISSLTPAFPMTLLFLISHMRKILRFRFYVNLRHKGYRERVNHYECFLIKYTLAYQSLPFSVTCYTFFRNIMSVKSSRKSKFCKR